MRTVMSKLLILCVVVGCLIAAAPVYAEPYFLLDSQEEWQEAMGTHIHAVTPPEWSEYMSNWATHLKEGEPYPTNSFIPPTLWVYGGGGTDPCTGYEYPNDAGLVMFWGNSSLPTGNYSSAWKYDYGLDPDLTNSTITVTITPPQFRPVPPPGVQINAVSFGIRDGAGRIRSWWWACPVPIPWNVPTTITINTAIAGVAAANPVATGFASAPGFNLANSQSFIVDENFAWVFGAVAIPPPGQPTSVKGLWNYWNNLLVTKATQPVAVTSKYYVKWSQRPVTIDPNAVPPVFVGWDEASDYNNNPPLPILADDWKCTDDRPVTDIHWWGSFIGWTQPRPPPIMPKTFHIGIWTDMPSPDPCNPFTFSHPRQLVWENFCDNWVWNFAGYDEDPRTTDPNKRENEACFQFNQLLSEDEWFNQEPDPCDPNGRVYWLSIAPIYEPNDYNDPNFYPWGWKTREHFFQDDAVRITLTFNPTAGTWWPPIPPTVGSRWMNGNPIFWPNPSNSWDLAFELTTNKPAYHDDPVPGDLNADKIVDFVDLSIMANNWLVTLKTLD